MKIKIFIIFYIVTNSLAICQTKFKLIHNLNHDLIVYDEKIESYIPYINDLHFKANALSFKLSDYKFEGGFLEINTLDPTSLFVDGRLYLNLSAGINRIKLEDLYQSDKRLITIFGLKTAASLKGVNIVYPTTMITADQTMRDAIIKKQEDPFLNTIIVTFLLILFGYSFIRITKPKIYTWYFGASKLIGNTSTDTNVIVSSFSGSVFILFAINSLVLSFCINLYMHQDVLPNTDIVNISNYFILKLLLITLIIYVGFILKFFLLRFIGGLIGIQGLSKLHYFEFNRLITLISCIVLPISLIAFYTESHFGNVTQLIFIILFLLATLRIILVVNRVSSFRIVYLFSYICTTEIIPILILAKYFGFEHL